MEKRVGADFGDGDLAVEASPTDSHGEEDSDRLESTETRSPKQLDRFISFIPDSF